MKQYKNIPLKIALVALLNYSGYSFAQTSEKEIISNYLRSNNVGKSSQSRTFNIIDIQNDKKLGGKVVNITQTYNDIPVYGATSSILIKNDNVSYSSNNFVSLPTASIQKTAKTAQFNVEQNFGKILSDAGLKADVSKYTFEKRKHNTVLSELAYFPDKDNNLSLVYVLNFYEDGTNNYWNILVDAQTGQLIEKSNLTVFCKFDENSYSHDHSNVFKTNFKSSNEAKIDNFSKNLNTNTGIESASYRVFQLPIESPSFGSRTLVTNPWFEDASPLGWHNDGDTSYTITQGNNTSTYADETGGNTSSGVADGGSNRIFDFEFDDSKDPATYKDASITNLFYITNKMHDIAYRLGFNEEGRNFQSNNFGKGEEYTDADPVLAEARDGGGTNNANFATPPDGYAPRMQMYLWQVRNFLNYNSPDDLISRKPSTGTNVDFGAQLTTKPVTSDVVLVSPIDACANLDNTNLSGKIALIERGTCTFDTKFKKAQDKGAVGVIIYNPDNSRPVQDMTGTDATVTIPGVLVNSEEGNIIKSKLDNNINVNVSLQYKSRSLDGSVDNGIIAHEYTHGITTRSTGNGSTCLNPFYANEQMGEGWSDFFALMLTNRADATSSQPRGVGTYVYNEPNSGTGIRPARYSPDFSVNPFTYGDTNGMAFDQGDGSYSLDVHSIGFVWATMLWDLHWNFADKYGFSNDIINHPESGSAKILQLVFSALKLQGCFPSFVKGRDAIIAADQAINNGENKCMIWKSFARRGLGVNADPGKTVGSGSTLMPAISDQVEDFSVPVECENLSTQDNILTESAFTLYPNPAKNEVSISTKSSAKTITVSIYNMMGIKLSEELLNLSSGNTINTSKLPNGVYIVKGFAPGVNFIKKLIVKK